MITPINGKKVLGILQNPWFKPDTNPRYIKMYAENQDFHRRVLLMSRTGMYLHRTFADLYDRIWWDNASQEHGTTRDHSSSYDVTHVTRLLKELRPDIVMAFGRSAQSALDEARYVCDHDPASIDILFAPHPMARGNTMPELIEIAKQVKRLCGIVC